MNATLTHKGWFGLCPVHIGDPYGEAPLIVERHRWLVPLFVVSEWMFSLCFLAMEFMRVESFGWPVRITGVLAEPIQLEAEEA